MTAKGVDFESINYTEQGLTANELKGLLHQAGLKAQDALRTNEAAYRKNVAGKDLDDEHLIRVMVEHPELIQRPIVVRGNKAVLARPVDTLAKLDIK